MTSYHSNCAECGQLCDWIECPTGGWWAHRVHPLDEHDAEISWRPLEEMDDDGEWITQ